MFKNNYLLWNVFLLIYFSTTQIVSSTISTTTMTDRPKVLVKNSLLPEKGLAVLKEKCDLFIIPANATKSDITNILKNANGLDAIIWSGDKPIDDYIFDASGPNLKILASVSAGVDHIPVAKLKSRGVQVTNTPGVLSAAVAEIAVLLTLAAARRQEEGRRKIVNNEWVPNYQWLLGQDLVGSTVGIVGLGHIGQKIAKRLIPFEIERILYTGHKPKPAGDELGAKFVSLDELLCESDFIISAVPLNNETALMFNKKTFGKMKNTAVFVNIGRGGVVNHDDLVEALKTNQIFAAGLDVMTPEPLPADHPLTKLPNCILMPHLGSATVKTRLGMVELAAKNVLAAIENKPLLTPV